jgi:hypothetical protein
MLVLLHYRNQEDTDDQRDEEKEDDTEKAS